MRRLGFVLVLFCLVLQMPLMAWERRLVPAGAYAQPSFRGWHGARMTTLELLGWRTQLDGKVNINNTGSLNLASDAEIGDETSFGVKLAHSFSTRSNIALTYNTFEHSGKISRTYTFEGLTFSPTAILTLKNYWIDVTYSHMLTVWGDSCQARGDGNYIDALIGIKLSQADLDLSGISIPVGVGGGLGAVVAVDQRSWSQKYPIPYIGFAGAGKIGKNTWLNGHLKFLSANAGGGHVRTYDFDVNAAFQLNPRTTGTELYGTVGYRNFEIRGDKDGDYIRIGYKGPTFSLMARF